MATYKQIEIPPDIGVFNRCYLECLNTFQKLKDVPRGEESQAMIHNHRDAAGYVFLYIVKPGRKKSSNLEHTKRMNLINMLIEVDEETLDEIYEDIYLTNKYMEEQDI